jgi:threonine dehydratase
MEKVRTGKPVEIEEKDSIADALLGGIGLENRCTFRMVREYVDELVLVSEDEIAEGMFFVFDKHHLMVEGAAAVGISALLFEKASNLGQNIVVVLSGGNVKLYFVTEIVSQRYTK